MGDAEAKGVCSLFLDASQVPWWVTETSIHHSCLERYTADTISQNTCLDPVDGLRVVPQGTVHGSNWE